MEWYEECLQRNVQIQARIPTGYQPSIVYCHTGRRTIITPAKRAEQRKAFIATSTHSSKSIPDPVPSNKQKDTFSPPNDLLKRTIQPTINEPPSITRTVNNEVFFGEFIVEGIQFRSPI